ncbi:HNH endonuclease signature motif containing protein [Ferrimonas balearica]|uniref:HNH endonuclease n=1 Tax=Ferrimonas balearica TaxID=44012 RepID=UPI001C9A183B|nr:HNH endonuclease signature motif containing protein [Ferrimonas balearica]MBY5923384.1 HNH endonuclease [Ferrimonas balearica]MBY5995134.1 HNH endonuclease [Ferrimonas balearica]
MDNKWTEEELRAAVEAYVEMRKLEAAGRPFVKKQYYRELSQRFGRTEKSFEYRMQNISYIYDLMGRSWVSGLKPAKNVGERTGVAIEQLISEFEEQDNPKVTEFESQVSKLRAQKSLAMPKGNKQPNQTQTSTTSYERDPRVKAWVLQNAKGQCECCDASAPFITAVGEPFLEVHHLHRLADGGPDTTCNAIAICPNCHRALHYAADKSEIADAIYNKISRLKLHA